MATKNDVTGDEIRTGGNSNAYKDNWDAIFGKKEVFIPCPECGLMNAHKMSCDTQHKKEDV